MGREVCDGCANDIELPDGRKLLFGGKGTAAGLSKVSTASTVANATADMLKGALGTLASVVGVLEESIGKLTHRPDKVEIEFRASLSGECDLWIVAGDGEAEFKVTLGWDGPHDPASK